MSLITIECPECSFETEIDDSDLGATIRCSKCKETFIADAESEGDYGLVEDPKHRAETEFEEMDSDPIPMKSQTRRPVKEPKIDKSEPLSDEKKDDLLSSMERWAEE
jgi:predicted Zn finger-like uncharacterized protein